MKTFNEWLEDKHPEFLEEGMMGDYMKKFALPVTAAMGMTAALSGNTPQPNNKPAVVRGIGHAQGASMKPQSQLQDLYGPERDDHGRRWVDNEEFMSYAVQQVERQLGGSQSSRIPKPEGWDDLSDEQQYQIYNYAHDALVQQYDVKNKDELQRMFDRETAQGRYDGSNPYKIDQSVVKSITDKFNR